MWLTQAGSGILACFFLALTVSLPADAVQTPRQLLPTTADLRL